jgi:hypothetical protein
MTSDSRLPTSMFGMIGRIVIALVQVVAAGWHVAWRSGSGEFHPRPASAEPVRPCREKDRLRTGGNLDGKSNSARGDGPAETTKFALLQQTHPEATASEMITLVR